jgi:hypothetical protein
MGLQLAPNPRPPAMTARSLRQPQSRSSSPPRLRNPNDPRADAADPSQKLARPSKNGQPHPATKHPRPVVVAAIESNRTPMRQLHPVAIGSNRTPTRHPLRAAAVVGSNRTPMRHRRHAGADRPIPNQPNPFPYRKQMGRVRNPQIRPNPNPRSASPSRRPKIPLPVVPRANKPPRLLTVVTSIQIRIGTDRPVHPSQFKCS